MSAQILCGIYRIRNTLNEKVYVGSAVDIRKRWQGHKSHLDEGVHHCRYLQRAWLKHGEIAFVFEFIEAVKRIISDVGRVFIHPPDTLTTERREVRPNG